MKIDLIIDGNYVLNKNTFALFNVNMLYGKLHESLDRTIKNCKSWYHFDNIYFASDSKEPSWRKKVYPEYKANRKRSADIDWEFVHTSYSEFKQGLSKNIVIFEEKNIEGDDWIYHLVKRSNKKGNSTIILSNDYDIKQLIRFQLDPLLINLMVNEMFNREKIFLPNNYEIFISDVRKHCKSVDLFDLNDDYEFLIFLKEFINKREIHTTDATESLIVKIISGDKSDNITSAYQSLTKTGKIRGIGEAGAKKIYTKYIEEFGDLNIKDNDLLENIADIICEVKKISYSEIDNIKKRLNNNLKLISLDDMPNNIKQIMESKIY